jgi:hypothetical protein
MRGKLSEAFVSESNPSFPGGLGVRKGQIGSNSERALFIQRIFKNSRNIWL